MSRRLLIVLALALCAAPLHAARKLKAIATLVEAPAQVSQDGVKYKELKAGNPLFSGDVMRTGETGRVVIRFVDGSQAAIAANTDVALRRLTPSEDPVKTTLSLLKGSLRALVKKLNARSSFEVETYNTVVAVKGTDFEVGVSSDRFGKKQTVAACFETNGKGLEVSGLDRKDPVTVGAGQKTSNSTGKPEAPSVLRAKDLQKALEKYRGLTLQAIPTPEPDKEGTPAVTPSAAQAQAAAEEAAAQTAFDNAARQAESALGAYLDAMDRGDLDAQAAAQGQLEGLRESAQGLEEALTEREQDLQEQIEEQRNDQGADPSQRQMLQAQLEEVQQLRETLQEVARQAQLEAQADAAQGNLFLDKDGYRVQMNSVIKRADANKTIQRVTISQRSNGPNSGRTEFQHLVTFNKPVPSDWAGVYERPLNDPANLAGGNPDFWRVKDVQKTFNAGGDCICLEQAFAGSPVFDPIGGKWGLDRTEFFQAVGNDGTMVQAQRSYDSLGVLQNGSDLIVVSSSDLGTGLRLSYDVVGTLSAPNNYLGNLFTVDVNLPGSNPALNAALLGGDLYALATADLGRVTGNTAFELTFRSPAYAGRQVSPLLDKASFADAFREGWR